MTPSKVLKYIDIIKDLRISGINPDHNDYKKHVEEWIIKHLFNGQKLTISNPWTCSQSKYLQQFSEDFSTSCREKWLSCKENFKHFCIDYNDFVQKPIDFSKCFSCIGCEKCTVKVVATAVKVSSNNDIYFASPTGNSILAVLCLRFYYSVVNLESTFLKVHSGFSYIQTP